MSRKTTILVFYGGVVVISVIILSIAFWLRGSLQQHEMPDIVNAGGATIESFFPIERDLTATRQDGEEVKLSDLRGKVWVVAQFFAVCPHCAVRNGAELRELYDEFKDHPDFHIVCITVDPGTDDVEKLGEYASALGADTEDWWFLNAGDEKATHRYLEEELKFFGIRERVDPAEIEAQGRFSHDLGFLLVDRDFQVVGKWPLAEARSEIARERTPELYEALKLEMHNRIRQELAKSSAQGTDES